MLDATARQAPILDDELKSVAQTYLEGAARRGEGMPSASISKSHKIDYGTHALAKRRKLLPISVPSAVVTATEGLDLSGFNCKQHIGGRNVADSDEGLVVR